MYDHLSELAQRLGMHTARGCTDGLRGHFGDELLEDFPDEDRKSLGTRWRNLKPTVSSHFHM